MLTKSGDEVGIRGVQAADLGAHRSPQSGRLSLLATHLPALPSGTPKAGCLESLNWMSRWGEAERDARVGALRGRGGWSGLSWSRDSQLFYRDSAPPQSAAWMP